MTRAQSVLRPPCVLRETDRMQPSRQSLGATVIKLHYYILRLGSRYETQVHVAVLYPRVTMFLVLIFQYQS